MTKMIEVEHLTKDYSNSKGVFDISFSIDKGIVMGFLGPNGAGKTTTIRHLMGFIKPDSGSVRINNMDCFTNASEIMKHVGYLPGEIAFMNDMKGNEFLHFMAKMKGMNDLTRMKELLEMFELDPKAPISKMSKGMKQKIGIVCAFMNKPDILILDEPTSGLDPLMQGRFVELVQNEKKRGATILMSSHIFEEIERTCDQSIIIKNGHIIAVEDMKKLRENKHRYYIIEFHNTEELQQFVAKHPKSEVFDNNKVRYALQGGDINAILRELSSYDITDLETKTPNLEELFLQFYGETKHE